MVSELICEDHKPVWHRDSKEPWCKTCGLNKDGQEPVSWIVQHEKRIMEQKKIKARNAIRKAQKLLEMGNINLGIIVMERALSYLPIINDEHTAGTI